MHILEYYQSPENLDHEDPKHEILCLLLSSNSKEFNSGLDKYSRLISSHVGERTLKKLLKDFLPHLVRLDAFRLENGDVISSSEALDLIETCLYQEILFNEYLKKSGRRGFFISDFKQTKHHFVYFCFEFLLLKTSGVRVKDLLALAKSTNFYELNIISQWNLDERLEVFIKLSRAHRIGVFQNEMFVRFMSRKRINDVEDILDVIFSEISVLTDYTDEKGEYFSEYGNVKPLKRIAFPRKTLKREPIRPSLKVRQISPLERNLRLLKLRSIPKDIKELKKQFYRLAMESHPDKFEHMGNSENTMALISSKFRLILCAYEFIERELDNKKV